MRVLISIALGLAVAAAFLARITTSPARMAAMRAYAKQPLWGQYASVHLSFVSGFIFTAVAASAVIYVLSGLVTRRARLCLAPSRACSRC